MTSAPDPDERTRAVPLPLLVVERSAHQLPAVISPARRVWRVARFLPLLMALVATGGVVGLYFQPPGLRKLMAFLDLQPGGGTANPIAVPVGNGPAGAARPPVQAAIRFVAGLGRLKPEGEVLTLAPPYGAGDARIAELRIREGDQVQKGAIMAVLDNERPFMAALESARATVAAREASLRQVRSSMSAGREEARAQLARAEASAQNAMREFERAEALRQRGITADQSFEQKRTQRDETQREVERARATLSRYGAGDITDQPDVVVAARTLGSAEADLARAAADLEKAYVRAPVAGTVLSIAAFPGEKPGTQGILSLADLSRMKAEVEVYQAQIGRVSIEDPVELTAEALPQALKGKVTRIGLEVARQTITDASPAASTDARIIKVTIALDDASAVIARRFTNLQVTARIFPQGGS